MGAWQARSERQILTTPAAIWALWEDPARWADWNPAIATATIADEFAVGGSAWILFNGRRRPLRFQIVVLEPQHRFVDETRLPGARLGHEHRIEVDYDQNYGVRVSHRIYLDGPLARFWAWRLGPQIERDVELFLDREALLAIGAADRLPEAEPPLPRCPLTRAVKRGPS